MSNSNIAFGATAFILGIVGAVSSMGAKQITTYRVFTVNKVICTLITTVICGNEFGICTTGTVLHRTVFTLNSTNCVNVAPRN
jgi:hypothetical protein